MTVLNAAVLLGASEYPHAESFKNPSFRKSKVAIDNYLRSGPPNGFGVTADHFLDLFDSKMTARQQLDDIDEFLTRIRGESTESERNILLYYIGHGYLAGPHSDYCLAVSDVRDSDLESGMLARKLGEVLRPAAMNARIFLILDCCFAAQAAKTMSGDSAKLLSAFDKSPVHHPVERPLRGTALLCASSTESVAYAPEGNDLTVFTNAFLNVLRSGTTSDRHYYSLDDVREKAWDAIQRAYPLGSPQQRFRVRPEVHAIDQAEGDISRLTPLFPISANNRTVKIVRPPMNYTARTLARRDTSFPNLVQALNDALNESDSIFDVDWEHSTNTQPSPQNTDEATERYLLRLFLQKLLYAASQIHQNTCGSANIWICHSTRSDPATGQLLPAFLISGEREGHFELTQLVTKGAQRVYLRANRINYQAASGANKDSVAAQVTVAHKIQLTALVNQKFRSEQEKGLGITHILGIPLFNPQSAKIQNNKNLRGVPLAITVDFSFREDPPAHVAQAILNRAETLLQTLESFEEKWRGRIQL